MSTADPPRVHDFSPDAELIAHGLGDVVVVGSSHCAGTMVLRNPTNRQIADCLGFNRRWTRRRCATWRSSAPGRPDSPPPSTPPPRDSTPWWSRATRRADRLAPAPRSRPIWLSDRHFDVRGGNIKRVASAVGEGAIAVAFVHRVLAE